ncbi:MAG: methyltransferase domain-containing protein [Cyanobacteria bacterium SZAS LIN-2]|nr:methyltransferase domain-containing protein [Cyanobacteria bacterium SZAS LIN-2]
MSSEDTAEKSSKSAQPANKKGTAARKLAVSVLVKVEQEGAFANLALANALKGDALSQRDKAFVMALVLGVLRNQKRLDAKLAGLSKEPLIKLRPAVRNLLRLAIFQLDYMQDIPESAVVDTAVELGRTKSIGHVGISRYINGVLRSYLRERPARGAVDDNGDDDGQERIWHYDQRYDGLSGADNFSGNYSSQISGNQNNLVEALSQRYSMPSWLVSRWLDRFGEKESLSLLAACQNPPKLTLRVNETACETGAFATILQDKGIKVKRSALVPSCLTILDRRAVRGPIENIPGYTDGIFSVQDEAAAFVSQIVNPAPGDQVIDLCAAPGGKALNLAELMDNKGKVTAVDINENRLNLIKTNRERLSLTNIEIVQGDGTTITLPPADKVLVDAPCSGTGVINKRADIRLKRTRADIGKLTTLQKSLLKNAATLVKPGGVLVYSTCSLEQEENEDIFSWFLSNFKDFKADDLSPFFPADTLIQFGLSDSARHGYALFLPSKHDVSGFFVARFKRKDES